MSNISSFFLGSLITLACSFIPFILSSRQLSKQAKRSATLSTLIIRGIEESGVAKFRRNNEGEPIGMIFDLAIDSINSSASLHSHQASEIQSNK